MAESDSYLPVGMEAEALKPPTDKGSPAPLTDTRLQAFVQHVDLPSPKAFRLLRATEFRAVYSLSFDVTHADRLGPASYREPDGSIELILRLDGHFIPHVKTPNEVAAMSWVRSHTKIPLPTVVRHSATDDNPLGSEYTLLEKLPGVAVSEVYRDLDAATKKALVEQLAEVIIQLNSISHDFIGGLCLTEDDQLTGASIVEVQSWQLPDLHKYWAGYTSDLASLNAYGPFTSYTDYLIAKYKVYSFAISTHPALKSLRSFLPRIEALTAHVTAHATTINNTKYILSHKDLHFANIMFDPTTQRITGILDWEFAQVVPAQLWDPGNFLWNGHSGDDSRAEQARMLELFRDACVRRGAAWVLQDAEFTSDLQRHAQSVVTWLRALTLGGVRGSKLRDLAEWRGELEAVLERIGV